MAIDLDPYRDVHVTVGAKRWTLGKMSPGVIAGLQDWLRPQVQTRIDFVRSVLPNLAPDDAAAKVEECVSIIAQLEGFSIESPLGMKALGTSAGQVKFVHLRLLERDEAATEADAWDVIAVVGREAVKEAAAAAARKKAAGAPADEAADPPPDPNAAPPAAA